MKRFLISLAALAVVACASDQTKKPETDKASSKEGELSPVGVIPTTLLHDPQRNKDLDISIEYPTRGTGPFPVIIDSNTYGISNRLGEALVANWTGHGYVVIRPAHADAGAIRETMRESNLPPASERQSRRRRESDQTANGKEKPAAPVFRGATDEVESEKQTEAQWRDRARDLSLVIDSLPGLEEKFPELKGKIDRTKIGLSGDAYGAFTALLLAGMRAGNLQMTDSRVGAVLAMSPEGVGSRGLTPESFRDIKIPVMFMSGSRDYGATEDESPDWRKTAYLDSPPGDKYWVLIEGARHSTFAGMVAALDTSIVSSGTGPMGIDPRTGQPMYGIAPPTQPNTSYIPERSLFERIRSIGLDFFDAYLKGDAKAKERIASSEGSNVIVEKK